MQRLTSQHQLIAALRDSQRYPHTVRSVRVIETHISWIVLAGKFAYKIKKAVDLGFLDYTSLSARKHFCAEELRLNRRTASELYLDVLSIGGSAEALQFGVQPAIEYAVKMRRFLDGALMDECLRQGKVTAAHVDALASTVALFHARAATVDLKTEFGSAATIRAAAQQNFDQLRRLFQDADDLRQVETLQQTTMREWESRAALFEARRRAGCVRECHGDLHLGNIALINGAPVPFDCIEFSQALRWIDVMDEVAFTMMDLLQHGQPDYAWRFLNAYLEASGDYAGVAVLHFYLAYRAAVRAKIAAIRARQTGMAARAKVQALHACRRYLALAQRCLHERRPALIITHGLPGSGKTTFAQYVIEQMGAVRIRSDVERKRLHGLQAGERSRGDIYDAAATEKTYTRLLELARSLLQAGYPVIVDAAFLNRAERAQFRRLAQALSIPFAIASLHAQEAALRQRLDQRRHDASEADVAVLEKLRKVAQPLSSTEHARTAEFSTAQAPGSRANAQGWRKLASLLSAA
ncbi:AAA family ATPase [Ferrigenium sp. UT5]|uniref:bifunctional aminoglycoside phosphotransferase/ATP-binding protein n=1 Tax=Ferrigenium sp. UT5 TaxID=3242105 RepID=UPI00354FEF13